ncbi:agouti-signaling protein-like isoform X1 [Astyanax mexicanus]|uniref:Agouti-signaling protein-like isoform X1 n=1 Tax=Astyanax mexicanus TaxID=7994 RepID=A0A8T2LPG5_ASTMX|nr:agouti-signaling protein-like isoform X1 [Astyanax mexicanus]
MAGRYGLSLGFCLVLLVLHSAAETHKKHENDAAHHHSAPSGATAGARNQDKPKRLFARTRYLPTKQLHVQRPKPETVGAAPVPVRRCAGLMESCSGHILCCDSCASCHCRLFNTICHCWRLGNCTKKT